MSTPKFERDDQGLVKDLTYVYDALGRIDWRRMLPPQYLFVSPDYETEIKTRQNVSSKWDVDVTKCEDKELLVTLAGLKYLARLRGVEAVRIHDLNATSTEVTSVCSIQFTPNFENPDGLIIEAQASASLYSVSGKFQLYLAAFAQNRAYTRASKEALGIEILGFEEVDFKASKAYEESLKKGENPLIPQAVVEQSKPTVSGYDGNAFLEKRCLELNKNGSHSFEKIKEHAIAIRAELSADPATWTGFDSVSRKDAFVLVDKINKAAEKKTAKAK